MKYWKQGVRIAQSNVTESDWGDTEKQERRDGRLPEGNATRKRSVAGQRPHYLDLEEARQLLAEMNIHLTPRQIKRSSDMNANGKRKLPGSSIPSRVGSKSTGTR